MANKANKEAKAEKKGAKKEPSAEARSGEVVPVRSVPALPPWEDDFERLFGDWPHLLGSRFPRLPWPSLLGERAFPPGVRLQMPRVDVYEEKDAVVIKAELPGIAKSEIEVDLTGSALTIKGEKKKAEEVKRRNYYRSERSYGSFTRTIELPAEVKGEAAKATFKDGVLEVRLPKTDEAKRRQFSVKVQ
jgi:HSP20 family protein